jgi:predicted O-methyltransferase YrrM
MLAAVPRLAGARDRSSRAVRRALATTALDLMPTEERAWAAQIESWRGELLANGTVPGPSSGQIGAFIRWMSVPPVWARLLMRVVRELQPERCLELGTGAGVSAAYQAAALELNGSGELTTLERDDVWFQVAREGLLHLGLDGRARVHRASPSGAIDGAIADVGTLDFAFIDADHTREATLEHFHLVVPRMRPGAVVLLDDITWDDGMRRAWRTVAGDARVARSLGLHRLGVLIIADHDDPHPTERQGD